MSEIDNNYTSFINNLPFDIVTNIFKFLNQHDCLTLMSCCRLFLKQIPQYTVNIWKTIRLSKNNNSNMLMDIDDSLCFARCLGSHVKNIEFRNFDIDRDVYTMMQLLFDWGCIKVESLVYTRCATVNQEAFFQKLRLFGAGSSSTLTHISMMEHESNVSLFYVLTTCSQLTHLTYYPTHAAWRKYGIYTIEPTVNDIDDDDEKQKPIRTTTHHVFNHLIYLHIDAEMDRRLRLEYILKKCPNLQYLICASAQSCELAPDSIQLDNLKKWCPKLVYFAGDGSYRYHDDAIPLMSTHDEDEIMKITNAGNRDKSDDDDDDDEEEDKKYQQSISSTFYHLSVCEHQGFDQIAQHLQQYQHQVAFLRLVKPIFHRDSRDWSSVFQSLNLSRLQTLICDRIDFSDVGSLVALLNTSATAIQTLDIDIRVLGLHSVHLTMNQTTIDSLHVLKSLHTLRLCGFSFINSNEDDSNRNRSSITSLLKRIPHLNNLTLQESLVTFSDAIGSMGFECLKNLNHLELTDVKWPDRNYNNVSTRQQNNNDDYGNNDNNTGDGTVILPDLFQSLILLQGNNSYLKLETIRLIRIPKMTNELLYSIAHIPSLKVLQVIPEHSYPLFIQQYRNINNGDDANGDQQQDAILLHFLNLLKEATKTKELTLHHIGCKISNSAFNVLGGFPELKKLDIMLVGKTTGTPPLPIDIGGILDLVDNSRILESIIIHNAANVNGPPGGLLERIFQERSIPWFTVTSANRHSTKMATAQSSKSDDNNDNSQYLYIDDCIITRI
ncbi:hypothetical protein BDC45DRAFT_496474 [Circinella umbellata]|nr:hypothetical protein BDC45DRAFT_496474 [Circinella umbellata]